MKQTDTAQTDTPPQKAKKSRTVGREIKEIYRLNAENETDAPEFLSAVPIHANERRYIKQNYGAGLYLIEEKQGGRFKGRYEVSIEDFTETQNTTLTVEMPTESADFGENDFDFEPESEQSNAWQYQLLIEKEKTKRLETELRATKAGSQNEMQTTVSALERAYEQNRELMMLMLSNAQKPQQDATQQALNMLEKSFGIVNRAKAISDEISPNETSGGGSSLLGDVSKLINSIGQNAPTFIPLLGGLLGGGGTPKTVRPAHAQNATTTGADGQGGGLVDLANKVVLQQKEVTKK